MYSHFLYIFKVVVPLRTWKHLFLTVLKGKVPLNVEIGDYR